MNKQKEVSKVCSRGHEFVKSREFPVCPKCWPASRRRATASRGGPGYYKKRTQSAFRKLT